MDWNITSNNNSECKISQILRENLEISDYAPYFTANLLVVILVGTFGNILTFTAILNGRIR